MACSDGGGHVRTSIECRVKGPTPIYFDREYRKHVGCAGVDILFTSPSTVGEIVFRNYYVANVKVLVRGTRSRGSHQDEIPGGWILSVGYKELMPSPNLETGSHDLISISATESLVPWTDLVAVRLILRQPSPQWKSFTIEEVQVFGELPRLTQPSTAVPQAEADRLLALLSRQTLTALSAPPPAIANHKASPGYEIVKLSQV